MASDPPVIAFELARIKAMLPPRTAEMRSLGGPGRPWLVRYGSRDAVLRRLDAAQLRRSGFTPAGAMASIEWLHAFLGDLAETGFIAPAPVADLNGRSVAEVDGSLYELLSYVAGEPLAWPDGDGLAECGRVVARFHVASARTPPRGQRPGALPFEECRPAHPDAQRIREAFTREVGAIGPAGLERGAIHGDATNNNVVVAADGGYRLVDYAIAYVAEFVADIASALWRNGRSGPNAIDYDPARVALFVRGYTSARPLDRRAAQAIVVYLKGRGLQLQQRLELRGGDDPTVMARLLSVERQQSELERAIREG